MQTLVRLRRVPESDYRLKVEILEIKAARMFDHQTKVEKYGQDASTFRVSLQEYKELFSVGHLRRRTMIACLLQVIQQFTGISKSLCGVAAGSKNETDAERRHHLLCASILRSHWLEWQLCEPSCNRSGRYCFLHRDHPSGHVPGPVGSKTDLDHGCYRDVHCSTGCGNTLCSVPGYLSTT